MIETEVVIFINRKEDIDVIKKHVIEQKIGFPVYIFEYESCFKLTFTSDYPEWELDETILKSFPNYEFTSDLEKGRKAIRVEISRFQAPFSTDGWNRQIENPLNETKYLIRKSKDKEERFNPKVKVLFENNEREYYVNITGGEISNSNRKGFLILDEFTTNEINEETDFFRDKLYPTLLEAFEYGCIKMQDLVNQDFEKFKEIQKKEKRKRERLPRKIVRDFIKSANSNDIQGLLKNLDEEIIFERRLGWRTELEIKGKNELEKYFEAPKQEFCGRDLIIRSPWEFKGKMITISVKYYRNQEDGKKIKEYRKIKFEMDEGLIKSITEII